MPDTHSPIRYVAKNMRLDLRLIAEMIPRGAKVLDIGCGDGALLAHLTAEKGADARGIEIDMAAVTEAVASGLAVIHGDADQDLAFYPDGAFDTVVLSRTLQAVERPREVLRQNLETSSAEALEDQGREVRVAWREEHTSAIARQPEEEEGP